MFDLDRAILTRNSTRMFLPRSVPRELVDEALALAQHAPSNSDISALAVGVFSGAARNCLERPCFRGGRS
jgi:nitroreductase